MVNKKLIYLIWSPEGQDNSATRDLLLNVCAPKMLKAGAKNCVLYIADPEAAMKSPAPALYPGKPIAAMAWLWVGSLKNRGKWEKALTDERFSFAAYIVEESVYTEYGGNRHASPRNWPDGRRSPGITAVTCMERPKKLTRDEWIRRWHGTMSPVSEEIQPRTRYVRNLIVESLSPGAPPFEGIVAENWPSKKHVTNPFLFYGASNPFRLAVNMFRILRAVTSFLSLRRIQVTMMSEYFVKTDYPKK